MNSDNVQQAPGGTVAANAAGLQSSRRRQ